MHAGRAGDHTYRVPQQVLHLKNVQQIASDKETLAKGTNASNTMCCCCSLRLYKESLKAERRSTGNGLQCWHSLRDLPSETKKRLCLVMWMDIPCLKSTLRSGYRRRMKRRLRIARHDDYPVIPAETGKMLADTRHECIITQTLLLLQVLNPETLKRVPCDGKTIGEVMWKGNIVMKGYLEMPEETDKALAGGWFHSGDLGVCHPDGYACHPGSMPALVGLIHIRY